MTRPNLARVVVVPLVAVLGLCASCTQFGPRSISRDRFEYSSSIGESWKQQTLLNVVKLRYLDMPTFVDVGQIVSGYSLSSTVGAGASLADEKFVPPGNNVSLSGSARFEDRPTITYTPLTGSRFVRGLMAPLPPDSVFYTIQSGWAADSILSVAVSAMNGLRNQGASVAGVSPPDAGFVRALELLREIQLSGAVGMRVLKDADGRTTSILTIRTESVTPEILEKSAELRRLLRLDPEKAELKLVYGSVATNPGELAVLTYSVLHILMAMSAYVEVPAQDVEEGRAMPGWEKVAPEERPSRLRIRCSEQKPADAFSSVQYRGRWFWIDDRDLVSKRALAIVMLLFTLSDTGEKENLPLITIPAQ